MKSFSFAFSFSRSLRLIMVVLVAVLGLALTIPRQAKSEGPTRIESDASSVARAGKWTSQSAAGASGGGYLYSSGAEADVLTLEFTGSSIEIFYVAGPTLGTLAIEVDDTVLRTVITTADATAYQQSSRIDYLNDEPHTLKVYAQEGGVIAVDAFLISPSPVLERGPGGEVNVSDDGGIQSSTCAPVSTIYRVSVTQNGDQPPASSFQSAISADGRFVAFYSGASLVGGDGDAFADIYVYDRLTCELEMVSYRIGGQKGNNNSFSPAISADGRYVAFDSLATNLISSDTNGLSDIFVHDRQTHITSRVSVSTGGAESTGNSFNPSISADGRFVSFETIATNFTTDTNGNFDIYVRDRLTNQTGRVSVATGGTQATGGISINSDISADGRYVTFMSGATNLVAGDTNGLDDVFVNDRQTNTTTRVSIATGGAQGTGGGSDFPAISGDARYVTFQSFALNLVATDTNGIPDIFVHDRNTATTTRVNLGAANAQASGGGSFVPDISGDGRYVTFESDATNLVTGDTNTRRDIFVRDRTLSTTVRVSLSATGVQANSGTESAAISSDGRFVAFVSDANNLVAGDTNGAFDVFSAPRTQPAIDALALFNPTFNQVNLLNTLADNPPISAYTAFSAYALIPNGQWVMGDWNGDGLKTPGVYANGPFYYTNKSGESQASDWRSLWIGVAGAPAAGRFNGALANDCIGAAQTASLGGQTVFVLYFTCDLSGNTAPTISSQWLSAVLPDSGGFSGVHQFGAGDFDGDGVDSIAVRRGPYIAFGNVAPVTGPATFNFAQFIGAPLPGADTGIFVVGNWDGDLFDSFALFYQNGELFFRNDLLFNSGAYGNQSVGTPFAGTVQATAWH